MQFIGAIVRLFLSVPPGERPWFSVVAWWELRRIAYNALMLLAGGTSLALFVAIDDLNSTLPFDESEWEPLSVLVFGTLANVFYTIGWVAELALRRFLDKLRNVFAPATFVLGTVFSAALCFAPTAVNAVNFIVRSCH